MVFTYAVCSVIEYTVFCLQCVRYSHLCVRSGTQKKQRLFAYTEVTDTSFNGNFQSSLCGTNSNFKYFLQKTCLSRRRPGFSPWPVHVAFGFDRVAQGQVSLRTLRFYPVSAIPLMLHSHLLSEGHPGDAWRYLKETVLFRGDSGSFSWFKGQHVRHVYSLFWELYTKVSGFN